MFLVHSNVGALYHQSTQRDNAKVKTDNFKYPLVDNKVYHFKDIIQYKDELIMVRIPLGLLPLYKKHYLKATRITHFKLGLSPQFKYVSFMCQHHINGPHVLHN